MAADSASSIAVSSAFASVLATLLANPFEVMKIRQQTGDFNCEVHPQSKVPRNFMYVHRVALVAPQASYYSGMVGDVFSPRQAIIKISTNPFVCTCLHHESMIKAFHHIYTTEGMSTFFNGWKYAIKQATVSNICYFLLYERLKILLENNLASGRYTFVPFLSAAVARTLTTTVTFPLEYWRVLQSSAIGYTTRKNFQLGHHVTSAYLVTVQRDVVFSCIFWVLLENVKAELARRDCPTMIGNLISGVVAGVATATLTLPLDLIKTRKQVSTRADLSSIPGKDDQKSTLQLIRSILRQEGVAGLFKGYKPRMAKVTVHAGVVYVTYEYLKEMAREKSI